MLSEWQMKRLMTIHENRLNYGTGRDDVTVLAYHFWMDEGYDSAFKRVECAIRETWLKCGSMKTVLVVNKEGECVKKFAECFSGVSVQVEESLLPGKIFTMSADFQRLMF